MSTSPVLNRSSGNKFVRPADVNVYSGLKKNSGAEDNVPVSDDGANISLCQILSELKQIKLYLQVITDMVDSTNLNE